jgi:hypothetical protein
MKSRRAAFRGGPFLCRARYCKERSDAAIQEHALDCFATLAMTKFVVAFLLLLCACRKEEPAAPTPEQSAQLNEAENMLNAADNEEGPADRSTGPSNISD